MKVAKEEQFVVEEEKEEEEEVEEVGEREDKTLGRSVCG